MRKETREKRTETVKKTDKRKEENLRVKSSITKAMLELMQEKSFSEITITELIRQAKVARISFYRNYASKEEVLITLIEDVLCEFYASVNRKNQDFYCVENVKKSFTFFLRYQAAALDLYQSGYGSLLLDKLNRFHEKIAGTMSNRSMEKYQRYLYIGALYNTAMVWLENGAEESVEDLALEFCKALGIGK